MTKSQPQIPKPYSVPRRFGIGTILAVATAVALLIWCLQLLHTPPAAIVTIAVFLAVIGGMQAVFEKAPRLASIVVGQVCMFGFVRFAIYQQTPMTDVDWILVVGTCLILGMFLGYVGGIVVASLFLVMDRVTSKTVRRPSDDDQSPFDDSRAG